MSTEQFDQDMKDWCIAQITCPACNHLQRRYEATEGLLGDRTHMRCRYCGHWWSTPYTGPIQEENEDGSD